MNNIFAFNLRTIASRTIILLLIFAHPVYSQWQPQAKNIEYFCTADSSMQKAKFYSSGTNADKPLLVALHPWSSDYTYAKSSSYSAFCIAHDWVFIHPDFRGPNNNPDATGSEKAIADIIDAVDYCIKNEKIDTNRIYLAGASGGGHMALLVAAKRPDIWAGVTAWVPISDLIAWYTQTKEMNLRYWQDIYKSCGGDPTVDSAAFREAYYRSSINFLVNARNVKIDINAGIKDGHNGYAVPVSQSLLAFNRLCSLADTISSEQINYFVNSKAVPPDLINEKEDDPLYGEKEVLFRRRSANARITIFDGIHEIIYNAACEWLAKQNKSGLTEVRLNNTKESFGFNLFQNYPNPFNSSTEIKYSISSESHVVLTVFDVRGRAITTLVDKVQQTGNYLVAFDTSMMAKSWASGVYFCRLQAGGKIITRKLVLLK